ncbi:MAG TPA: PAS domain S-box protein, partial [Hanamia sp.]|nr:PAS domain S-box protein [Hanamia sp.]
MPGNTLYTSIEFQHSLLDSISKNILDFLAVTRKDDRKIVFVNKAGAEMFEYKNADSLLNTLVLSLWKDTPDEKKLIRMDKQIESKGFYSEEIECKTKKGSLFWGLMRCSSFSAGGEEFHLLQIEKIDRARAAEESLLKAKQRFGALMDYASLGVVIINSDRQIILINAFALQLFGFERKELKGKNIEILIPHRFHKIYKLHQERFYKDPKTGPIGEGMTLFARKKDGTEFPVEISLGHYTIKKETFVITFVSDVSARKKAEEQIIKLNTKLEKKVNERTNELAATIKKIKEQIGIAELAKAELLRISEFQK